MFSILSQLMRWLVGLAVQLLPASPFRDFVAPEGWALGMGWLNWLVPVSDMLGLFDAWLIGCAAWMGYRWLYRRMGGLASVFTGGSAQTV